MEYLSCHMRKWFSPESASTPHHRLRLRFRYRGRRLTIVSASDSDIASQSTPWPMSSTSAEKNYISRASIVKSLFFISDESLSTTNFAKAQQYTSSASGLMMLSDSGNAMAVFSRRNNRCGPIRCGSCCARVFGVIDQGTFGLKIRRCSTTSSSHKGICGRIHCCFGSTVALVAHPSMASSSNLTSTDEGLRMMAEAVLLRWIMSPSLCSCGSCLYGTIGCCHFTV